MYNICCTFSTVFYSINIFVCETQLRGYGHSKRALVNVHHMNTKFNTTHQTWHLFSNILLSHVPLFMFFSFSQTWGYFIIIFGVPRLDGHTGHFEECVFWNLSAVRRVIFEMVFLYVSQSLYWVWKYILLCNLYHLSICFLLQWTSSVIIGLHGNARVFLKTTYDNLTTAVSQAHSQAGVKVSHQYICSKYIVKIFFL